METHESPEERKKPRQQSASRNLHLMVRQPDEGQSNLRASCLVISHPVIPVQPIVTAQHKLLKHKGQWVFNPKCALGK